MYSKKIELEVLPIARQLLFRIQAGDSLDSAILAVRDAAPASSAGIINELEKLLRGAHSDDISIGPYATLNDLVILSVQNQGNPSELFVRYQLALQKMHDRLQRYWGGFYSIAAYATGILVVAIIAGTVYRVFAVPQFISLFAATNAELPPFTSLILGDSEFFFPGGPILALIAVGLFVFFTLSFKKYVYNLQPIQGILSKTPVFRRVIGSYNQLLVLVYADLLSQSGTEAEKALSQAETLVFGDQQQRLAGIAKSNSDTHLAINLAIRTKTLKPEIEHQRELFSYRFRVQLDLFRELSSVFVLVLLGSVVGAIVISMYLPIFQLGHMA